MIYQTITQRIITNKQNGGNTYEEITNEEYKNIPYTLENVVSYSQMIIKKILSKYGVD